MISIIIGQDQESYINTKESKTKKATWKIVIRQTTKRRRAKAGGIARKSQKLAAVSQPTTKTKEEEENCDTHSYYTHTHVCEGPGAWVPRRAHKSYNIARWLRTRHKDKCWWWQSAIKGTFTHRARARTTLPRRPEAEPAVEAKPLSACWHLLQRASIAINQARRFAYYLPIFLLNFQNLTVYVCEAVCMVYVCWVLSRFVA